MDDETLYAEDLNAELQNIKDNSIASMIEGYSTLNNVPSNALMDTQEAPFPGSSRSYAQTTADEIAQLRFMLASITGKSFWYNAPDVSLLQIWNAIKSSGTFQKNQITSGLVNSVNYPICLNASGSAASVTLEASTTALQYIIGGTAYAASANFTLTGLSTAPSSLNTAILGSGGSTGATAGEYGSKMTVGSMGAAISALVGQFAAFKIVHSAVTEYFLAFVESTTVLSRCRRGYFFDNTNTRVDRLATAANGDTVTLMKLSYIFVKSDGTLDVTYNTPSYGSVAPASPSTGDYWFDSANLIWKRYSGTAFVTSNATFLGLSIQDTTKCVATRTFEFAANWSALNSVYIESLSPALDASHTALSTHQGQKISVAGNLFDFGQSLLSWSDLTGPFAAGVTSPLSAGATYYLYITDQGGPIVDIVAPYDRGPDLQGYYHPGAPWRCVGAVETNSSGIFSDVINIGEPGRPTTTALAEISTAHNKTSVAAQGGVAYAIISQFTTTSTSAVIVTGASVTLKISGRPVLLIYQWTGAVAPTMSAGVAQVTFQDDGNNIFGGTSFTGSSASVSCFVCIAFPATVSNITGTPGGVGERTYSMYATSDNSSHTVTIPGGILIAKEL